MRLGPALAVAPWFLVAASAQERVVPASEVSERVEAFVRPFVERNDFAGAILIARDGETIFRKAYGMANVELGVTNTPRTKFGLASISKLLTAIAVLRLVEQERLALEDPLSKFLPEFPGGERITLEMLVAHRAGVPHSGHSFEDDRELMTPVSSEDLVRRIGRMPRVGEPGGKRQYSTAGYSTVGRVLEVVTGLPYEAAMRRLVFEPTGMIESGDLAGRDLLPGRAAGYEPGPGGGLRNARPIAMENKLAGGSLYSTVEDLARLHRALRDRKLLGAESQARIVEREYGGAVLRNGPHRLYGSNGSIDGYMGFFDRYFEMDLCVILLANVNTGAREILRDALLSIPLGLEHASPPERPPYSIEDSSVLDECLGPFQITSDLVWTVVREGGDLAITGPGKTPMPLDPIGRDRFFLRARYSTLTFRRDASGHVGSILWEEGGTTAECPRVR